MKNYTFYGILFTLSAYLCFLSACGEGEIVDLSDGSGKWDEIADAMRNLTDDNTGLISDCLNGEITDSICDIAPSSSSETTPESSSSVEPGSSQSTDLGEDSSSSSGGTNTTQSSSSVTPPAQSSSSVTPSTTACQFQQSWCPGVDWNTGISWGASFSDTQGKCFFLSGANNSAPSCNNSSGCYVNNGDGGYYVYVNSTPTYGISNDGTAVAKPNCVGPTL